MTKEEKERRKEWQYKENKKPKVQQEKHESCKATKLGVPLGEWV